MTLEELEALHLFAPDELGYADVNRDGVVGEYDYILIKRAHFGTYVIG